MLIDSVLEGHFGRAHADSATSPTVARSEYFFESFASIDDFLKRGIGYCIVRQNRIVSAATSMAASRQALDIEIETAAGYRREGLATVVGAQLVAHCLERGIEPRWLAANAASERLALRLGYIQGDSYETLSIEGGG